MALHPPKTSAQRTAGIRQAVVDQNFFITLVVA
jgi:hypothetical protein